MASRPGWRQVLKAVFGAFIGIQSEQQRQQDFSASSPVPFIIAGLIIAALFVLSLLVIVKLVLA